MKKSTVIPLLALLMWAAMAIAGDEGLIREGTRRSITLPTFVTALKEGPGMDTTTGYCSICHSLDYITTQPKFPLAKWQAEVTKMAKVYGAPLPEEIRPVIAQYITSHYGEGSPSSSGPASP